ncbi:Protein WALLS ARE THIN 1 [Dendrobium catenatum]|uniref:Protein WALLS ARE THIN 1 n=1 Tax=Dendrobium catenatum TaxID=906689 RepID=A0A2I0VKX3_9ASPA|nr:Protein WALLS ARE THIN 1 [Dendrobium catenatum]
MNSSRFLLSACTNRPILTSIDKVRLDRRDGIAKVIDTLACVAGATVITLYKGPTIFLPSSQPPPGLSAVSSSAVAETWLGDAKAGKSWTLGCIYLTVLKKYPARLFVTSYTCFFGVIQFLIIAAFVERKAQAWAFHSGTEVFERQLTRCSFLASSGLHRKALWKFECSCWAVAASDNNSRLNDGWDLPSSLCPCSEPRSCISTCLQSWEDYYRWRGLPFNSPAAMLLHWWETLSFSKWTNCILFLLDFECKGSCSSSHLSCVDFFLDLEEKFHLWKSIRANPNLGTLRGIRELGQLKADFEEKIADFQNQIASVNERMEETFAEMEYMLKKLLEAKSKPVTLEAKETTGGPRRDGNPNMFRGRENPEAEKPVQTSLSPTRRGGIPNSIFALLATVENLLIFLPLGEGREPRGNGCRRAFPLEILPQILLGPQEEQDAASLEQPCDLPHTSSPSQRSPPPSSQPSRISLEFSPLESLSNHVHPL